METLNLQFSPINALNLPQRRRRCNYLSGSALMPIPTGPSFFSIRIRHNVNTIYLFYFQVLFCLFLLLLDYASFSDVSEMGFLCFSSFFGVNQCRGGTRMQVVEEEYEVKQMKDMAAARKRWEALVIFFLQKLIGTQKL